ncbi:MAG: hypothetical protein AAF611_17365 [Bacteroidota bacterium]
MHVSYSVSSGGVGFFGLSGTQIIKDIMVPVQTTSVPPVILLD